MRNVKKLLIAIILVVAITHRHEDYCSNHPHGATGKQGNPYTFGPWVSGNSEEKINHMTTSQDTLSIPKIK